MKWCILFFFQAEDGIRDLVRSRGLGDVYKRQEGIGVLLGIGLDVLGQVEQVAELVPGKILDGQEVLAAHRTVSYTHLTLPTSDLV